MNENQATVLVGVLAWIAWNSASWWFIWVKLSRIADALERIASAKKESEG